MYRVELKELHKGYPTCIQKGRVPNVPCGVESVSTRNLQAKERQVPNVPCGVERKVEVIEPPRGRRVPNVPCGVERAKCVAKKHCHGTFLMYRVELKVPFHLSYHIVFVCS